jgi:hypothetical protein
VKDVYEPSVEEDEDKKLEEEEDKGEKEEEEKDGGYEGMKKLF